MTIKWKECSLYLGSEPFEHEILIRLRDPLLFLRSPKEFGQFLRPYEWKILQNYKRLQTAFPTSGTRYFQSLLTPGSFGECRKALHNVTGQPVAVKIIHKNGQSKSAQN